MVHKAASGPGKGPGKGHAPPSRSLAQSKAEEGRSSEALLAATPVDEQRRFVLGATDARPLLKPAPACAIRDRTWHLSRACSHSLDPS